MSNNYTKYFLEIGGRRMYVTEPEFEYDIFFGSKRGRETVLLVDGHASTAPSPVSPAKLEPTDYPIHNPLHKILKENYDEIEAAKSMKIRKHPRDIILAECSLGEERKRGGKISFHIQQKLFRVQVVTMYKELPRINFYLLTFQNYLVVNS